MSTLFSIGIFLSFFLAVLLFTKRHRTLSDNILGTWLITIGFYLLNYDIYLLGYWEIYPHLVGILHPFPLLFGPFLYLYIAFSLRKDQHFHKMDLLHFLPFTLLYLSMMTFYFGYSAEEKIRVDQMDSASEFRMIMMISLVGFVLSGIIYPIISYRKIGKYQKMINQNFAYAERISMRWLKLMIHSLTIIVVVVAAVSLLKEGLGIVFGFNTDLIFFGLIVVFIFLLGYFGIRYQGIFSEESIVDDLVEPQSNGAYKKSGLKDAEAQWLQEKLQVLMATQKPFLEAKLSLSDLAGQLNTSSNNLSQVINRQEEKNFYDFVNEYRVKEFIVRATNPENKNLNLLGIAYDSGFNSKSSFNEVFKKQTGKTPSRYLKERQPG